MCALARWCFRRRHRVLASWLVVLVLLGGGAQVFGGAFRNDFRVAESEPQRALDLLQDRFPACAGDPRPSPAPHRARGVRPAGAGGGGALSGGGRVRGGRVSGDRTGWHEVRGRVLGETQEPHGESSTPLRSSGGAAT